MATNGSETELTDRQRKAVAALLTCRNVPEAAQRASVGERTLYRWLADDDFRAALLAAEGEAIDAATRRLVGLSDAAITVFTMILENKETAPTTRLKAAASILDFLLKLRELRNIEERLTRLEEAANVKPD